MNNFLIVAAHPDDELMGCGGTTARLVKQGMTGHCLILSRGMLGRGEEYKSDIEELLDQSRKANNILGISDVNFLDFPDNQFDSVPLLSIIQEVEKEINRIKPDMIFTHYSDDLNIDHRITFQSVLTSCRPQPGFFNPDIYSFFCPSSTDWVDGLHLKSFHPNSFFNIKDTIDQKLQAVGKYELEMRPYPHSRSIESVKIFSEYWGHRIGMEYVEPFILIRKIR